MFDLNHIRLGSYYNESNSQLAPWQFIRLFKLPLSPLTNCDGCMNSLDSWNAVSIEHELIAGFSFKT